MTRALAVILLITCATAAPAEAGCKSRGLRSWPGVYSVRATACDPVSRRCVSAIRRFTNPVWR